MQKIYLPIITMAIIAIQFCSCRTKYVYIPSESRTDSVVVEKVVPVVNPADSAAVQALLECDEKGRVILRDLQTYESRYAHASLVIDSLGNLIATMHTDADTVFVKGRDTTITKREKIPYPVEKPLVWWQKGMMVLGGLFLLSAVGIVLVKSIGKII